MRTALLISHHFPPSFAVGGKRAWRFARHLPAVGWRAVVLTIPLDDDAPADPSLQAELGPDVEIVREAVPPWWPRPRRADSDGTVTAPTVDPVYPPPNPWRRAAWRLKPPLGREALATPFVAAAVRRLARTHTFDVVWATSSPYACLLWGAAAAQILARPLCLDLRDPWRFNFLQRRKPPWTRRAEAGIESHLLHRADRVTLTSEATTAAYRAFYSDLPADHFTCIETGYDEAAVPAPGGRPRDDDAVEVVHFGNVYGKRRIAAVLHALAQLRRREPARARRIRLRNLGRVGAADLALADELGVRDALVVEAMVPHAEGLRRLAAADLQLLVGYGDETLFLPAKLFDYMVAGTAVLCIERPSDATAIVERHRLGRAAAPDDVARIADALDDAITAHDGGPTLRPDRSPPPAYAARACAARLGALFDALTTDSGS